MTRHPRDPRSAADREARLDALRAKAREATPGSGSAALPEPGAEHGYYGQPILKPPVWTWEVPLYFFVGGTAGAAAVIAAGARLVGRAHALERTALAIALAGALLSVPLLISDLGRPGRFLNMLRVLKLRSPMSIGAWVLAAFTPLVLAALVLHGRPLSPALDLGANAIRIAAALLGLVLATYTGVLLAVTAIPAWNVHRVLLPPHFAASALGSAAALLELIGFLTPATYRLGLTAALVETGIGAIIEFGRRREDRALRVGRAGVLIRIGGALVGPLPLVLRLTAGDDPRARIAAALAFLAGAILTRYAWLAAGRASAADLGALFAGRERGAGSAS
jgi:formate-dependent nitrite reductase membrane component NrfD